MKVLLASLRMSVQPAGGVMASASRIVIAAISTSLVVVPAGLLMVIEVIAVFVADVAERYVPGVAGAIRCPVVGGRSAAAATASGSGVNASAGTIKVTRTRPIDRRAPARRNHRMTPPSRR